jgi:hypothetical protein
MRMTDVVEFQGDYRWLSNFWLAPETIDGITFTCNEQWYQWSKMALAQDKTAILRLAKPGDLKRYAHQHPMVPEWDQIKLAVMERGLRAKFDQNPDLKQKLIDTDDGLLQETNSWKDGFWGVDIKTGKGFNHLGRLLMQLRAEYQLNNESVIEESYV